MSCQNKELVFKGNKGEFAELEVKITRNNSYNLSVNFSNNTNDTLGIICIGNVRQKQHCETELGRILYDTIIEIKQGNYVIKSTDIEFNQTNLSERIHQLLLIKPQSKIMFPIFYRGNIIKDFNLSNSSFYIRITLKPQFENFEKFLSDSENIFLKKHKYIRLVKKTITTPFIKIDP
jgi:hypothetical protein